METWKPIPSFKGYSVSDLGRVYNDKFDRYIAISRNAHGTCHVGLNRAGRQHRRSLPLLVAEAFLDRPSGRVEFDTPIHLNGDTTNNRATNLMWRPRWFALKYMRQFSDPQDGLGSPVLELRTQERYLTAWDAALSFGLIHRDLTMSILNRTFVWPTFQEFRFIEN